jgi:hypothetical protein
MISSRMAFVFLARLRSRGARIIVGPAKRRNSSGSRETHTMVRVTPSANAEHKTWGG